MKGPDNEQLRRGILNELYVGAFARMSAMLVDADHLEDAGEAELTELVKQYGVG